MQLYLYFCAVKVVKLYALRQVMRRLYCGMQEVVTLAKDIECSIYVPAASMASFLNKYSRISKSEKIDLLEKKLATRTKSLA